jgi:hypothetical protein
MDNDNVSMVGQLDIILTDAHNNIKHHTVVPNLVVATGKAFLAKLLAQESVDAMSHMALGEGTAAANAADTALQTETARIAIDSQTRTDASVTFVAVYGPGVTGSFTEAGIFNDDAAGTMLCRTVYGVITKTDTDFLTINWTVTVG